MNGTGDISDDAAIWIHPSDPTKSVILGTNKATGSAGGLYVFDLSGSALGGGAWNSSNWFSQGKIINEVDVRYNFRAGDQLWDIVAIANRTNQRVDLFRVNQSPNGDFSGLLGIGAISTSSLGDDNPYGTALFRSAAADKHFLVASSKNGKVAQWELNFNSGTNQIVGQQVWIADVTPGVDSEVEGIVVDDEREVVYIAAEDDALYRYNTSNGVIQNAARVTVDTPGGGGNLTADIEGLTMYFASNGEGYLLASSQGSSDYHVYRRDYVAGSPNAHLGSFSISAGNGIDAVTQTDGIAVANTNLGGQFASGLFIAHDASGDNPTNYKLVPWEIVAASYSPGLLVETTWNPRTVPEPSTGAIIGYGAMLIAWRRFVIVNRVDGT